MTNKKGALAGAPLNRMETNSGTEGRSRIIHTSNNASSRKKAIEDHCKKCIFDNAAQGTWREQVFNCTSLSCSLWPFRPTPYRLIASSRTQLRDPVSQQKA